MEETQQTCLAQTLSPPFADLLPASTIFQLLVCLHCITPPPPYSFPSLPLSSSPSLPPLVPSSLPLPLPSHFSMSLESIIHELKSSQSEVCNPIPKSHSQIPLLATSSTLNLLHVGLHTHHSLRLPFISPVISLISPTSFDLSFSFIHHSPIPVVISFGCVMPISDMTLSVSLEPVILHLFMMM